MFDSSCNKPQNVTNPHQDKEIQENLEQIQHYITFDPSNMQNQKLVPVTQRLSGTESATLTVISDTWRPFSVASENPKVIDSSFYRLMSSL